MNIGEDVEAAVKACPICINVSLTIGFINIAIALDNGAATNIITIKSRPAGVFSSKNLTTNDIKYPATNPGSIPNPETVKPTKTA